MSEEKRLETLSEEIKLLKGEIKNSLTSVRDYLLNMELPSSEFSTILAALSGDSAGQKITIDGSLAKPETPMEDPSQSGTDNAIDDLAQPPPDENLLDMEQPEDLLEDIPNAQPLAQEEATEELMDSKDELIESEDLEEPEVMEEEVVEEEEEPEDTEESEPEDLEDQDSEQPEEETEDNAAELVDTPAEEEQPMELERTTADLNQGTPKVNMLANLINWVSMAKQEIGDDLLPTFLDVYGVSGHLSLELKEVILHLAERTQEKTEPCTDAEVWSRAILSLHGILTGGDAPLNPPIPSWKEAMEEQNQEEEIIEIDKQPEKPVKLKLVFPNGNGKEKEYCLDLTPESDDND